MDTLGFDLQQRYGGQASFVSAGGYHHHLGLNTWAGVGAPPSPEDAARLLWFECILPSQDALDQVLERLHREQIPIAEHAQGWLVRDPAQNGIVLRVRLAGVDQARERRVARLLNQVRVWPSAAR